MKLKSENGKMISSRFLFNDRLGDRNVPGGVYGVSDDDLFSCPGQLNRRPCHSVSE